MSTLLAIGTALPPHRIEQSAIASFAREHFGGRLKKHEQLMQIFANAKIDTRHLVMPLSWFGAKNHTLKERNDLHVASAEALGVAAARLAMQRAALRPEQIDYIVFVTSTGFAAPSLDARLIEVLGLRPNTRRSPLWGLGCAGGVAGLARAEEFTRAYPDKIALLVAVETCSLTFQFQDFTKQNFVATALFADGAAAAIVAGASAPLASVPAGARLDVIGTQSTLFPNSASVMGWDVVDTGLSVIFAPEIPARIARDMRPEVDRMASACGIALSQIRHFPLHPGGARVLESYREAFDLPAAALDFSREILKECGNMSSPTALFALDRLQRSETLQPHDVVLTGALGPGFSAELVLLRNSN